MVVKIYISQGTHSGSPVMTFTRHCVPTWHNTAAQGLVRTGTHATLFFLFSRHSVPPRTPHCGTRVLTRLLTCFQLEEDVAASRSTGEEPLTSPSVSVEGIGWHQELCSAGIWVQYWGTGVLWLLTGLLAFFQLKEELVASTSTR